MSHKHTIGGVNPRTVEKYQKAARKLAKGQNAENPLASGQVPSEMINAELSAYLRQQAEAFVGREHPARNALYALSVVAACSDSGKDLRSLAEALRIAQACLRRFGV